MIVVIDKSYVDRSKIIDIIKKILSLNLKCSCFGYEHSVECSAASDNGGVTMCCVGEVTKGDRIGCQCIVGSETIVFVPDVQTQDNTVSYRFCVRVELK